jgi:hypothetical protein
MSTERLLSGSETLPGEETHGDYSGRWMHKGVFLDLILNANCMLNGWSNIPSLQDILGDEAVGART